MALHDDLLDLVLRLVTPPAAPPAAALPAPPAAVPAVPPAPPKTEAELRRGISTAYYALFHLLVDVTTTRGVATAALRAHVARNFEHRNMRAVCAKYAGLVTDKAGQPVPLEIQRIADGFVQLQEARYKADYNVKDPVTSVEAQTSAQMARDAFSDWATISANVAADAFLTELLVGGIKDR
jgi:hypothetical protein